MKLNKIGRGINYSASMMGILLALSSTAGNAGSMGPTCPPPGKFYIGAFGGGGASDKINISQYSTAYFLEAAGGPLAVNSFGRSNSRSVGIVGGHVGYQWAEMHPDLLGSQWSMSPAAELEGYYMGRSSFTGHDINNETVRLPEHDFLVTYPMSAGVFLANAVLNFNYGQSRVHPYVAGGIGAAVLSISNASSIQVAPPEVGINHYNSNPSNSKSAFASQAKAGLSFDLSNNINIFAEYRGLYIANSSYTFGSTVYPGHAATARWHVIMDSQFYNMGAVGINYTV